MHFPDIFQGHTRVHQEVLPDLQVDFANDPQVALLEKVIVREDAAGDRVFYSHHSPVAFFFAGGDADHLPESSAGNYLNIVPEELLGGYLVEAAFIALYGY